MAQQLNINAALAAEMAEVLGLTISKCTQIVKGRMNTKMKSFASPNSLAGNCCYGLEISRMKRRMLKWVEEGLIYFGPPGFLAMPKAMPQPIFVSPRSRETPVDKVERGGCLTQGEGAVGYSHLLTPGATPMQPGSGPLHLSSSPPQTAVPHEVQDLTELKRTYSVDRLNYIPPVPPRTLFKGQSAGVQTSPEVLTGEGVGAGAIEVETQYIQTSPGLMAGDKDPTLQQEHQSAIEHIRLLEQQLADKEAAFTEQEKQAAASTHQLRETLLKKDEELDMQAQTIRRREQEVEAEHKQSHDEMTKEWEKERKLWWEERHQQEEGWKREWETWEREKEELREQAKQLQQAKDSLLSQSKQSLQAHKTLRVQHEQFRKTHEQLRQTKDALLNENEQFRKQQVEFEIQREQMRKAQEDLLCHTDQVRQARHTEQVEVKDLYKENLDLMKADLEKTEQICQYQAQQVVLEQEIQKCRQDVERLMKEQLANLAQTARVPRTPSQQSQVPAESHPGSVAHSQKSVSSRESCTRAPVDLGSSHVINARPLSQALAKPFQFATPSHSSGLAVAQSQGAVGGKHVKRGKAKGDPEQIKSLQKISQVTHKSPSQESGSTIRRGIKIISATAPDNIYHPSGRGHALAKELGQGVSRNTSSPMVEGKPVLTLPPIPSRMTSSKTRSMAGGSQSNLAQGATSYISSVPPVKCPDMEIFQEDGSFLTDVSSLGGEEEPDWESPDNEELLDEAVPLEDELGGESYAGVSKHVSLRVSNSQQSHPCGEVPNQRSRQAAFPYRDYRFESSGIPKRGNRMSGSTQGSAAAVPEHNRGRGNAVSGEAFRGKPYQTSLGGAQGNHSRWVNQDWDGAHGYHPQRPNQDWDGAHGYRPQRPNQDWDGAHGYRPQHPNQGWGGANGSHPPRRPNLNQGGARGNNHPQPQYPGGARGNRRLDEEGDHEDPDLYYRDRRLEGRDRRPRRLEPVARRDPKLSKYSGNIPWRAYEVKLSLMAQKYQWDEETKLAKLVEALEDKALTFFSSLSEEVRNNYTLVRKKMNSRFEPQEPPNTVRKQLQTLHQEAEESMEEWAECCQCFAYDAWGNMSIDVAELAAVETFCTGALDSEAVLPVLEKDPATLDDALKMLKHSVHNRRSVNTRSWSYQKTARTVSFAADSLSAVDIRTAGVANSSPDPTGVIQKVESDIKDLKATMAETQEQMSKLMELLTQRSRARSPSPNGPCFRCNEPGHIAHNCPKPRSPSSSPSREATSNKPGNP